ncbi:hypothetical protein [Prevotella pallens]
MKKNHYSDLSENAILKQSELLNLKGGYEEKYGCNSNVCSIDRSGAKDLCTDAYCRSSVGPVRPIRKDICTLFTHL